LRALKVFQERHSDVWLVNCWYNMWEPSVRMMESSQLVRFRFDPEQDWNENMLRTYVQNGLDPARIVTCNLVPNEQLRKLYAQTDIGIFPNRCEGGTNLVMMEYMACGKPVIASNTSGHKDILTPENALCLNALRDLTVVDPNGETVCRWQEPSLDELLDQLEYAYQHRAAIADIGRRAGEALKKYTWQHAAQRLVGFISATAIPL
jgi:glycosyltransferase involved in cell wall biosynthesis